MQQRTYPRVYRIIVSEDFYTFEPNYARHENDREGDLDNAFAHYLSTIAAALARTYQGAEIDVRPCYERSRDVAGIDVEPKQMYQEVKAHLTRIRQHALNVVNRSRREGVT